MNQEEFRKFMKEFVELDLKEKNEALIDKEQSILTSLSEFASYHGIDYTFLKSSEMNDIEGDSGSYDDYMEASMVYLKNIEELIGVILSNIG